MTNQITEQKRELLRCSGLPLAVYREIAAHLRQVEGVETKLIPQHSQHFDYYQSQVDGILIQYPIPFDATCQGNLEAILAYYAQQHGIWQRQPVDESS
ncbi:MAG: hypothetical protein SAL07_10930 [Oscillatoria sp. PMC 1051.18]|nr:hypothetical protein [Oscillatoria sp. PMC 1050.18]MEC5030418.1 hypothetical protein [Oscillatoria sp. PMC 1051.18]